MWAWRMWTLAVCTVATAAACATARLPESDDDASAPGDATVKGDGSACPQYDLETDPQHCGSRSNACPAGEVCSSGACKSSCQSPTTKCSASDGGVTCANLTSDTNHCGSCTTACSVPD